MLMYPRAPEGTTFSADDVKWAVLLAVCEFKSQSNRSTRKQSTIIDDCREVLELPGLVPPAQEVKLGPNGAVERQRSVAAEARSDLERIAPLVRLLTAALLIR